MFVTKALLASLFLGGDIVCAVIGQMVAWGMALREKPGDEVTSDEMR